MIIDLIILLIYKIKIFYYNNIYYFIIRYNNYIFYQVILRLFKEL